MVRVKGFDLSCGTGRVAALTCPRHVIHYRSRSNPSDHKQNERAGISPPLRFGPSEGIRTPGRSGGKRRHGRKRPLIEEHEAGGPRLRSDKETGRPERGSLFLGPSEGIRTPGLMVPNHARYQLRYTR